MNIRLANLTDVDAIVPIFEHARNFMHTNGNPHQWNGNYPAREDVLLDIERQVMYVCEENGVIEGVFALIIGDEPTYHVIENGSWISDQPYGTIHRIAGYGRIKGLSDLCYDFCKTQINHLKVDTHEDNKYMRASVLRNGFVECGRIYCRDGSPRVAYEYVG